MRILLDPNSLLEFLLNRSNFIGKVEHLSIMYNCTSRFQLYLSQPGLDRIIISLKLLNGSKKMRQLVANLKKRIEILRPTKTVAEKAKSSPINYDCAIEVYLAIEENIDALVTHEPDNFSLEKLNVITLSDLQLNHLELSLAKNINELPAVWGIPSEQIESLNKILYHSPGYIDIKLLEFKESTSQLELTDSSEKISTPSPNRLSPQSTNARSIEQIIADSLSNRPAFGRSTAQANILKSDGSATVCRAYKSYLDVIKESIHGLNASVARISEIQSSLVDRLSIKPPLTQLIAHPDAARFGNLAASIQVGNSSLINRLLPQGERIKTRYFPVKRN